MKYKIRKFKQWFQVIDEYGNTRSQTLIRSEAEEMCRTMKITLAPLPCVNNKVGRVIRKISIYP